MVNGALKHCINSHGPITKEWIGSASKRIVQHILNQTTVEGLQSVDSAVMAKIVSLEKQLKEQIERNKKLNESNRKFHEALRK